MVLPGVVRPRGIDAQDPVDQAVLRERGTHEDERHDEVEPDVNGRYGKLTPS